MKLDLYSLCAGDVFLVSILMELMFCWRVPLCRDTVDDKRGGIKGDHDFVFGVLHWKAIPEIGNTGGGAELVLSSWLGG